jgi:chromosome segregation ATPase
MAQEQRLSQVEELLADQMHKQDYIYEEVLTLKGNLDKMNSAVGTLVKTSRIMNGDVTFILNKTNVIVDKVTEIDERVERLETKFDVLETKFDVLETKFDVLETKFDVLETKFDVLETKFDNIEVKVDNIEKEIVDIKGLLGKILEKVDK